MPTLFYLVLGTVMAAALVVTVCGLRRAEPGYEDESGFHFGSPPRKQRVPTFIQSVLIYHRTTPVQVPAAAGRNTISQVPSARAVDSETSPRSSKRA